jgi:type III secretion protein R
MMNAIVTDPIALIAVGIVMALAPLAAVLVTSYSKIVIVLYMLRNALGLQQIPPGLVLNSLAFMLTVYIMMPAFTTLSKAVEERPQQPSKDVIQAVGDTLNPVKEPLRNFLLKHSSETERQFFKQISVKIHRDAGVNPPGDTDFIVIIPAFTVSELSQAFYLGFLLFLPFIAIDLIVANVLLALGMQMMSPTIVSLPLKLLLFVTIDGWSRLIHTLVLSY